MQAKGTDISRSAVFQAGGLNVIVVEIFRRNFLASMVPVIVNTVLNEHQLVIDIVAFVIKGDFHRSRLGEKQRGKILAGWVTRKMRTIAQYSIRDTHAPDNQITEVAEPGGMPRASTGLSNRMPPGATGAAGGSLRGGTMSMSNQMQALSLQTGVPGAQEMPAQQMNFGPPLGVSEMPGQPYPESIPERAELASGSIQSERREGDDTPTEARKEFPPQQQHLSDAGPLDYSPIDRAGYFNDTPPNDHHDGGDHYQQHQQYGAVGIATSPLPTVLRPGPDEGMGPPEPHYDNKPFLNVRNGGDEMRADSSATHAGDRWSLPSQHHGAGGRAGGGGGLRVANRDSTNSNEEWAQEAIMHMNFAGSGPEDMRRLS
jgi:hypothetical protein